MKILGIDPGLATVGLGLIQSDSEKNTITPIEWLTIQTSSKKSLPDRLAEIQNDLDIYINKSNPDTAVVEKIFFATNTKTAIDVAHCRGVILLTLNRHNIPIIEPTPLQLKFALTNDGSADKKQIQHMLVTLLGLNHIPKPDDAADALALAYYGATLCVAVA